MLDKVERIVRRIVKYKGKKLPYYCLLGILRDGGYNTYGKCKYCEHSVTKLECVYREGSFNLKIC